MFDKASEEMEQEFYKRFMRSDLYASFMADKGRSMGNVER